VIEPVKHILCPVDVSAQGGEALAYALYYARQHQAKLSLLYVLPVDEESIPVELYRRDENSGGVDFAWAQQTAQEKLHALAQAQAVEESSCDILIRTGDPATVILEMADTIQAGLIVMTTHGRSGLSRFFLGSVTERVIRESLCPVLTIRGTESEAE
jgi:nucleotide-binding universal stress UspA family protein